MKPNIFKSHIILLIKEVFLGCKHTTKCYLRHSNEKHKGKVEKAKAERIFYATLKEWGIKCVLYKRRGDIGPCYRGTALVMRRVGFVESGVKHYTQVTSKKLTIDRKIERTKQVILTYLDFKLKMYKINETKGTNHSKNK